ncbi:MAG: SLC13 family permease [Candidatus Woesearchaeota archaeon]
MFSKYQENLNLISKNWKKYLFLFILVFFVYYFTKFIGFQTKQSISMMIIVVLISTTFLFWNRRLSFAFVGIGLLLAFNVIDIKSLLEFAHFDIILFLISMMVFVGFLEKSKFFEFIIGKIINKVGNNPKLLIIILMLVSAISAAIIDEVTSIIIMVSIILHLTNKYKLNPIPFILMTVFATNIGSSATVVGNPVGVMVALNGGLTFSDFLRWAAPISFIALSITIGLFFLFFKNEISELENKIKHSKKKKRQETMMEGENLILSSILFGLIFLGLVFHSNVEKMLHLEKNTMLIGFAMFGAGIAMLIEKDKAAELIERRVDWWTLVFFIFLFASVGSLEYTGVIDILSKNLRNITGDNIIKTIIIIMIIGGLLSAVLDNVLAVAIMVPIVKDIISLDPTMGFPLWWIMLFAGTFFGNLTHIGSTANIVALGILQKRGYEHIGFKTWIKYGFFVTLITSIVAALLIILQLPLMP